LNFKFIKNILTTFPLFIDCLICFPEEHVPLANVTDICRVCSGHGALLKVSGKPILYNLGFQRCCLFCCGNKKENKKYYAVGTIPKSIIKIVVRDKIDTSKQIHDRALS
jgi:hypothetical protein